VKQLGFVVCQVALAHILLQVLLSFIVGIISWRRYGNLAVDSIVNYCTWRRNFLAGDCHKTACTNICKYQFPFHLVFIHCCVISVLDATAKLQSGILVGNLVSIGNFDQCIAVTDVQTHLGTFSGKHCLASLTWENDTFRTTMELLNIISLVSLQR